LSLAWSRFKGLSRASFGMTLAHGGLGIAVIGIVAITAWRAEAIISMKPGDRVSVAGYDFTYLGDSPLTGANYTGDAGQFRITRDGNDVATVVSEKRQFQPSGMQTTEVGLHQMLSGDLYVVMGDRAGADGRTVRVYFNPLVSLIWIGSLIMFFGGVVSLTDRRYRVGAPKPARRQALAPAE
jgi:cytochrome c-type biogenesis protein CcmF